MIVYADMLFLINALLNYLLLDASARFAGRARAWPRLLLAAGLGGAYALACVFPMFVWLSGWAGKLAVGALMLLVSFGTGKGYLQLCIWFALLSAAFAGVVLLLVTVFDTELLVIGSGSVYPIQFKALVLTAGCCYGLIGLILRRFGARSAMSDLRPATVCIRGRTLRLTALMDNGNALRDPVTGGAVFVLDPSAARQLLPELRQEMLARPAEHFEAFSAVLPGTRLVPYSAVGSTGLLLAARSDWVLLGTKKMSGVTLAFSPTPISGGSYQLIAGGDRNE